MEFEEWLESKGLKITTIQNQQGVVKINESPVWIDDDGTDYRALTPKMIFEAGKQSAKAEALKEVIEKMKEFIVNFQ